ncbi:hypothetical protein ACHAXT_003684 [Thalassiosira profunda]
MTSPAAPPLSNDTLRTRILTGGGGGNVRGSLSRVASRYAELLRSLASSTSDGADEGGEADTSTTASALQTELQLHDLEIRKLVLSSRASDGNASRHSAALERMQTTLSDTQKDIEKLTATLAEERAIKKNREEYNALAKMGNDKAPPVRVTKLELERVQTEMERVTEEVEVARRELGIREKQTRALMACLGDLKAAIREEDLRKREGEKGSGDEEMGEEGEGKKGGAETGKKRRRGSGGGSDAD